MLFTYTLTSVEFSETKEIDVLYFLSRKILNMISFPCPYLRWTALVKEATVCDKSLCDIYNA